MSRNLSEFSKKNYDLLVIGGGINGAAIANIAAGRGLSVALLEKGDFGSGTSSKSSKLIHGGIRYLENFEFDLVFESLRERALQLQCAPHLVKPLRFIIPVYKGDKRPLWMMRLGVFLYDRIAGRYRIGRHQSLSREELMRLEPGLKREGLKGGVMYFDAQMDDARLCLENVLSAAEKGAQVANYAEVFSFIKAGGKAAGVKVRDRFSGEEFEMRAKRILCAAGPWTNQLVRMDDAQAEKKVRTTKGIHLVCAAKISDHALLIPSRRDNRIFFVLPWQGGSMIGTTDTDYVGNPDRVDVRRDDMNYLIEETRRVFPSLSLGETDIASAFAGLRPLVRLYGAPSKIPRKHYLFETKSGILFVIGGKYTTYRKIAEDCVNKITAPRRERTYAIFGSGEAAGDPAAVSREYGLDEEIICALREKYGAQYPRILALTKGNPKLKERIVPFLPIIKAQIVYSAAVEMAVTADDIFLRRLSLGYSPKRTEDMEKSFRKAIAEVCPSIKQRGEDYA
ncbi:MAG TPA: glycerol-3-phosphate dehydrogenase [Candidatus Omnitrophota bacterium]|nr:glycerol-3-phosphate dehydrogenase [Candidatus Omnitrophota bacterium]